MAEKRADDVEADPATDGEGYVIDGQVVTMPVEVRSARQASATFLVDHAAATRVIADSGLTPRKLPRGKALASIALIDYVDNDLGDYDELALAFAVDDPSDAPPEAADALSTLIWRLPVNQEFTCAAGRQIWGFPKWVADLDVTFLPGGVQCVMRDDAGEILRVELKRGLLPMPRRDMEMMAYSCDDELVVRRTPWTTSGVGRLTVRPGGATIELGYGHPIADELRALGLPKRALMTIFDDHMTATFGEPVVV